MKFPVAFRPAGRRLARAWAAAQPETAAYTAHLEFERRLRENAPRSIDPAAWAIYNQWVSEQRTLNQKETKTS